MAAPPKRAAAPTAPVFMGIAAPSGLDDSAGPPTDVAAGKVVVGVVTPLVKGTPSDAELALVNAGVADEAVVSGQQTCYPGLRLCFIC